MYFVIFVTGIVIGQIIDSNKNDDFYSEVYNSLPKGCQALIDDETENINDRNEALSEREEYYR
jgi:hypothetical protein